MKLFFTRISLLLLMAFIHQTAFCQTYTLTANNESWATLVSGGSCNSCTINIPAGWTLKLNSNGTCNGCTFNGGTVQITSSFTFNNNTTNFNNDTVLVQTSTSFYNVAFTNDSVSVTSTMSTNNNAATFSNSRIYANANITLNGGTFTNDSVHLAAGLTFNNTPDNISGSNFTVTAGYVNVQGGTFSNDVFSFSNNSYFSDNNAFTTSYTTFYLNGNSYVKSNGTNTTDNTSFYMQGNGGLQASNALSFTGNSIISMSGNTSIVTSQLTTSGGSITMTGANKITSSNAISMTNTPLYMSGTAYMTGASFTLSGANITMAGTNYITSSNAVTISNATVSMTNSYITGSSMAFTTDNITMAGSSYLKTNNQMTIDGTDINVNGSSYLYANPIYMKNTSDVIVGDGTLASTAYIYSQNALTVADNSQLKISNQNNYFYSSVSNFTGGSSNYSISNDTYNCNHGTTTGYANSCTANYAYGCQTLNASGAVPCATLALADFNLDLAATSTDNVLVSWQDGGYATADHYVIERNTGNYEWTIVASIAASKEVAGNMQYTDNSAPTGTVYYRIARVDRNGTTAYSSVSSINLNKDQAAIQVFPNPVTGNSFNIATASTSAYIVNLYTITGQLLIRTELKGQTLYTIKRPSQLPTGSSLVVQIIGQQGSKTYPLIIR